MNIIGFSLIRSFATDDLLEQTESILSVHEFEKVSYRLVVDEQIQPTLLLGDYSLLLKMHSAEKGCYVYESVPSEAFKNFVGITHAEVIDDIECKMIVMSRPINVFAEKVTYERALSFLRYIINNEDVSSMCFSVTKGGSDTQCSSNNLSEKLIAGMRAVEYLNNEWVRFHHDPCTKNSSKAVIRPFSHSMPVDDRTIAHISTHLDSLTRTDSLSGDVLIRGQHYAIQQMVCNEIIENHNVFENQVILYFLKSFYQFLISLKNEIDIKNKSKGIISVDGVDYISLDQILRDSGLLISFNQERIGVAYSNTKLALNHLNREFKCILDSSKNLLPVPTQQALSKSHYMTLYRFIDEYYKIGEPSWRGVSELYGIRNISKLYEFVCLINICKSLTYLGFELKETKYIDIDSCEVQRPLNEPCNVYILQNSIGTNIKILYDIQTARMDELTTPLVGQLYDMVHYMKTKTWRPDFQIHVRSENGIRCHILDAKYSNLQNVRIHHMPNCAKKYGLDTRVFRVVDHKPQLTVPDSVTIIFSGKSTGYYSMYREDVNENVKLLVDNSKPRVGSIGVYEGDIQQLSLILNQLVS